VDFFGAPVEVPAGPARLALATGATVIPAAFPRIDRRSNAISVMAEFIVPGEVTEGEPEPVVALTQAIMRAHERFIHAYPEQWYMFREMWPRGVAASA
jgi:KDO2-lipid IV(A) lauroyltransferase